MLRRGTCPVSWGDMGRGQAQPRLGHLRHVEWASGVAGPGSPSAPPELLLTPMCSAFSPTGQEGAAAHAHYEAKAGLGSLQGKRVPSG